MGSLERHRDAGAYALGVLDHADAFRFEDHLTRCPDCRARLDELAPPVRLLRACGPSPALPAAPDPRLLDRLVDTAGRARRRRWLGGVAAGVALAVAGPSVALLGAGGGERAAASGARGEVSAALTARGRTWGTDVDLRVRDAAGPRTCVLVAVGADGAETAVTTWRGRALTTSATAALPLRALSHFEIRTPGGTRLLTLRPR
ncbi:anti-sigma factor family protein [Streptomyces sp. G45]|uniref:anti-sigma factor family protein n=1 Tax=Streptomyces sp. G45 TaxID=3406627 RepID=UPI003C19680F